MANPPKYTPSFSFTGFEVAAPASPKPGPRLDDEFANISYSLGAAIDGLNQIRRADGALANGVVHLDSLGLDVKAALDPALMDVAGEIFDEIATKVDQTDFDAAQTTTTAALATKANAAATTAALALKADQIATAAAIAKVGAFDPILLNMTRTWSDKLGDFELVGNSGDNTDGNALQNHFFDEKNRAIYGWAETGSSRRICRWNMDDPLYTRLPLDSAALSGLTGHSGGGIEYVNSGTQVKIWAGGQQSYTDGQGNVWTRSDYVAGQPPQNVQTFKLFPATYGTSAGCLSYDKKHLIAYAFKTGGADGLIRVFDVAALVAAGAGDRTGMAVAEWPLTYFVGFPRQGFAAYDGKLYIAYGGLTLSSEKTLQVFDYMTGRLISENRHWNPGWQEAAEEYVDAHYENEGLDFVRLNVNDPYPVLTTCIVSGGAVRRRRVHLLGPSGIGRPPAAFDTLINGSQNAFRQHYGLDARGVPYKGPTLDGGNTPANTTQYESVAGSMEAWINSGVDPDDPVVHAIVKGIAGPNKWTGTLGDNANLYQQSFWAPNGDVLKRHMLVAVEVQGTPGVGGYAPLSWAILSSVDGATAPSTTIKLTGAGSFYNYKGLISAKTGFYFDTTLAIGGSTAQVKFFPTTSAAVFFTSGVGTPEGVVTAGVGSLFTRTDGGASTTLYVKQTGTGNTGWAAK